MPSLTVPPCEKPPKTSDTEPAPRYQKVAPAYLGSGADKNQKMRAAKPGIRNITQRAPGRVLNTTHNELTTVPPRKSRRGKTTSNR
jgi:hypothetical protein